MRRRAKTINFGLLYGMSAFGLSNQLGVSRAEADIFLNNYFDRYSAVKKFMSDIVERAQKMLNMLKRFMEERYMFPISLLAIIW